MKVINKILDFLGWIPRITSLAVLPIVVMVDLITKGKYKLTKKLFEFVYK